jgi:serine/threonine protein kinase
VVLHELLTGHTPFAARSIPAVQRNILEATPLPPAAPPGVEIMPDAASLIAELLQRDPSARLGRGATGTASVQAHPFFGSLDFDRVRQRGYPPVWAPPREGRLRKSFRDSQGDLLQALPPDEIDEDLPGYSSGSSSVGSDGEAGTAPPDPRFLGFSFIH